MAGGCLYSGSGVDLNIQQGFIFEHDPILINNSIQQISENNGYGWPYSIFDIASPPTTSTPTHSPTPGPVSNAQHKPPPNIIIFLIDDITFTKQWNESAPNGVELEGHSIQYSSSPTPNIDAFKKEAVVFTTSYSASSKCTPSRYATLTGRQPTRSEWAKERTVGTCSGELGTNVSVQTCKIHYNDGIYNIPYVLQNDKSTPYYTGTVGKWHLMATDDYDCTTLDEIPNAEKYANCTQLVKQQGFDFVNAWYYGNIADNPYFSHNPEWMVSQSQRFINQAVNMGKPFFLYYSSTLTHTPYVTQALFNYSRKGTPKGTLSVKESPDDTTMRTRDKIWQEALSYGDGAKTELYASHYWLDESFGALIHYLKINNLYDNTFIVLLNDHGMPAKGLLYQHGSRIFNFVRYPPYFGDNGPYIMPSNFVVSSVDLAAVIFEIAEITPPNEYKLDGISWLNDVQHQIENQNQNNEFEQTCCQYRYIDIQNSHSIVSAQYQYIYRANKNKLESDSGVDKFYPHAYDEEQLYDLLLDPNQKMNQIHNISLRDTITTFQTLMRDYLNDVCPVTNCKIPHFSFGVTSGPTSGPIPTAYPTSNPIIPKCHKDDGDTIYANYTWKKIRKFREKRAAKAYLEKASLLFLNEYAYCGITTDRLEFGYKFNDIRQDKELHISMIACCGIGKTFEDDYKLPHQYQMKYSTYEKQYAAMIVNDKYSEAGSMQFIVNDADDENESVFNIKTFEAVMLGLIICVLIICACCCFVIVILHKYLKAMKRWNQEMVNIQKCIHAPVTKLSTIPSESATSCTLTPITPTLTLATSSQASAGSTAAVASSSSSS